MDRITQAARSRNMAKVRNRNTKPELLVRSIMHKAGFRFSLHRKDLPGTPDIVLPKYNSVVFVHGCFWHGHDCRRGKRPASKTQFWDEKLDRNRLRDKKNMKALRRLGWHVFVVWECQWLEGAEQVMSELRTLA